VPVVLEFDGVGAHHERAFGIEHDDVRQVRRAQEVAARHLRETDRPLEAWEQLLFQELADPLVSPRRAREDERGQHGEGEDAPDEGEWNADPTFLPGHPVS
jgi:hypothetical protein